MGKQSIAWLPRRYFPGTHLWVRRDKLAWSSFLSWETTQWHRGGKGRGGEGGGTPLYKPYRYVPPQRVGFLRRFGLKKGTDSAHFSLESGMILEGAASHPPPGIPRSSPLSGGYGLKPRQLLFFSRILAQKAILIQIWIKKIKKDNTGSRY